MKKLKTTDDAPESSGKCLLEECRKQNAFRLQTLAMTVYVLLVFTQIFFHEQWQDEVQAWLIARDCSIFQIFHMMRYEGHFALWHLLLQPFAGTGFPLLTLNVISVLLSCIAVWLLLYRSPFSLVTKLLLLLSAPLMYWYPVVARSYAVVPPLLFLLAICYPLRRQKPLRYAFLLALLANTHVYMEGMVAVLFCFFAWDLLFVETKQLNTKEGNRRIMALLLILVGVLVAFLQVAPAFAVTPEARFRAETSGQLLQRIRLILDSFANYYMFIRNPVVRFAFWMSLLGALYTLWRCSWRFLLIALSAMLWQFLFAALLYSLASPQQCYLILFMLIFTFWIAAGASQTIPKWQKNPCRFLLHPGVAVFLCLFTIFSYRQTLLYISYDLRKPFTQLP